MLRFEEVTVRLGGRDVLTCMTLEAHPGKIYGIIGPNGSGKTTLLRTAAGLLKASEGRIMLGKEELSAIPPAQRARSISYMPQIRPVPSMTARDLIACGRYPYARTGSRLTQVDRDAIASAVELTGVSSLLGRRLNELSGGERQRVYLAMMLAQQTDILLLDEPTNHLDPEAQFSTASLLEGIARSGRMVWMAIHDLPLALENCDELVLLKSGRIQAQGPPADPSMRDRIANVFGVELQAVGQGVIVRRRPN